jgi:glycosyltransferase involved in cell wall biosynthesis
LVVVGPVDSDVGDRADRLAARPNVTFLGLRPTADIPAYIGSFDVGIVPFVIDRLTEAVSPLKMYEYLAAGRGVVTTPLPACRGVAEVEIADGIDAFVAAIERRLDMDPVAVAERARAAASAASWERRIGPVLDRLESMSLRRVSE